MKVRRVAAGYYTVDTDRGVFEIARVEGFGHGLYEPRRVTEWFVTWPGERAPDGVAATLRDAKAMVAAEIEETS